MVTDAMPALPVGRTDVLLRRVGNEWVLFDASQGRAHVLNLTAAVVWTYCDGEHQSDAIADAIDRELKGGAARTDIQADVDQVLKRFAAEGLLQ
jgi:hypothetical protein